MEENGPKSFAHSMVTRSSARRAKGKECEKTKNWIEKRKRRQINFKKRRSSIIGKNDIVVNMHANKIKIEEGVDQQVVVKQEHDIDSFMDSVELINEDAPVKTEYPEAVVVTDDTESIVFNETGNGQDPCSNNLVESRQSERGASSSAKTAESRTVTMYKSKLASLKLKRLNQGLRKTLTQKNLEIRELKEKLKRAQIELNPVKGSLETAKTVKDNSTTMSAEGGGQEGNDFNQFCVRDQVTCYQPEHGTEEHEQQPIITLAERDDERSQRETNGTIQQPLRPGPISLNSNDVQSEGRDVFEQVVQFLVHNRKPIGQVDCTDEIFKNCRLVCKSWKETVDRVLQNDPLQMTLCSDSNVSLFQVKKDFTTPCSTIIRLTDITKNLLNKLQIYAAEYPSFNPFPNGHLMIDFAVFDDIWSPFSNLVDDLLKKFGEKVYYLTVRFQLSTKYAPNSVLDISAFDLEGMTDSFVKWLCLVPNMKSLCMEWNVDDTTSDNYQSMMSLPQIPYMKDLTVIQNSGGVILCDILARNQHICKLRLDGYVEEMEKLVEMDFSNLSELVIFPVRGIYFGWDFSKLKCVQWPLQRLSLIWPCNLFDGPGLYRDLYLFITTIRMSLIKNTLHYLSLDIGTRTSCFLRSEPSIPLLTHLRIKCDLHSFPLDDIFESWALKQFKQLKTLEIEVHNTTSYVLNYDHEYFNEFFLDIIKILSKASYWKGLPNLKRTRVNYVIGVGSKTVIRKKEIERNDLPTELFS